MVYSREVKAIVLVMRVVSEKACGSPGPMPNQAAILGHL